MFSLIPDPCSTKLPAGLSAITKSYNLMKSPVFSMPGISFGTLMSTKNWRLMPISKLHSYINNHRTLLLSSSASYGGWRPISPLIMFTLKNLLASGKGYAAGKQFPFAFPLA